MPTYAVPPALSTLPRGSAPSRPRTVVDPTIPPDLKNRAGRTELPYLRRLNPSAWAAYRHHVEVALAVCCPLRGGDDHHRAPRVGHDVLADRAEHRPDESAVSVRADHQHVASADAVEQHLGGVPFHRLLRDSDRIRRAVRVGFACLADGGVQQLFHR